MNSRGRPARFTAKQKLQMRRQIIAGLRNGKTLQDLSAEIGFNSKQALCFHFPGAWSEAFRRVKS